MSRKLTNEDIKERIYGLVGDEYELLSEYVNSQTKIKIKHVACGHEYLVCWNNFQQGKRCPKCGGTMKLTNEDIVQRMYELVGSEYTKLDENYINSQTKFKIRHETCGCEYMVNWANFQSGKRCPKCAMLAQKNKLAFTNEDIVKAMYKLVGDEYTKMDENYINSQTKFKIRHNVCEHEFEVRWSNFQKGSRCPKCNQPKGEKFIEDYLTNHNISFATQVKFNDCKSKRALPFDFGIIDDNKRVIFLIEFDGLQHYQPVDFFGGEETFKEVQLRDQIKDDYCKKNGIPLLRIRYDDEDIEEKLNLFINQEAERKV